MTTRTIRLACALLCLPLSFSGAMRPAGADGGDGGDSGRRRTIRLAERHGEAAFQDLGEPGPGLGDRLVFSSDIYDEANRLVGRDGAECIIVRIDPSAPPPEQQIVQCVVTVQLPQGQITFQGLAQGTENFFAITGGTGAFRRARGQAFVRDIQPLVESEVTIYLEP